MIAFFSVLIIGLIILFVIREALPLIYNPEFHKEVSLSNLLQSIWQPVSDIQPKFGLLPLLVGTLKVSIVSIIFSAPIAVLAAIYTNSFAPKWAKNIIKPVVELIAGIPTVVIGFLSLTILATLIQELTGTQYRLNAFLGGIALSITIIPTIYTITEDALNAIPKSLTEASLALGANKAQTAFKVILPAASPAIFAAILLGVGRAFGETMIVLMATGNSPLTSFDPFEPVRTLTATIGSEMAEVVFGDAHYSVLFLIGILLFILTFIINIISEFGIKRRLIKKLRGGEA